MIQARELQGGRTRSLSSELRAADADSTINNLHHQSCPWVLETSWVTRNPANHVERSNQIGSTPKKFVEWLSRGRWTDRTAYATREWDLPEPLPGAEWQIDAKFQPELLRDPELKQVSSRLEKGAELVIRRKRDGELPKRRTYSARL